MNIFSKEEKKNKEKMIEEVMLSLNKELGDKMTTDDFEDLSVDIISITAIASAIANVINNVYKSKGDNKKSVDEITKLIKSMKSINISSEIQKWLEILEIWIMDIISRIFPLMIDLMITAIFDFISKATEQLKEEDTKVSIDKFSSVIIDYTKRNITGVTDAMILFVCKFIISIFTIPRMLVKIRRKEINEIN